MKTLKSLSILIATSAICLSFAGSKLILKHENSYTFKKKLNYQITDKKEKVNNLKYHFGNDGAVMNSFDETEMTTILDMKNQVSITIDEDKKTAMVMSTKMLGKLMTGGSKESTATVTKTGKTKDILGYSCDEYLIVDKKQTFNVWITEEITMDYTEIAKGFAKWTKTPINSDVIGSNGFMMEMTSYNKKGEQDAHMLITEYEEVETTVNLSDYEVTALSIGM